MGEKYNESKQTASDIIRIAYENAKGEFFDILSNNLKIEGLPKEVPERYVKNTLFESGKIGVLRNPEIWLSVTESGVDLYGQPTQFSLYGANGTTFSGTKNEISVIRLNPSKRGIISFLELQSMLIAQLTASILQNVISVQNSLIVECPDNESLLTLKNMILQKTLGIPAIIARKGLADGIKTFPTNIPFIASQLSELKKEIRDETLTHFGIHTANDQKRERVQTAEVNANIGEAVDSVYSMIDTFNYDCEKAGLTARMVFNGVTEEMYETADVTRREREVNEI